MKIGLLICAYNRPEYLQRCLDSLRKADLTDVDVLIYDDASTDQVTRDMICKSNYASILASKNGSIKNSILQGSRYLFNSGCDTVINLDSDAIVTPDFISRLKSLKERFPDNIITGFNCTTKNRDGSIRHLIVTEGDQYNEKKSVGGINMMYSIDQFIKWIEPATVKCLYQGGNWDHQSCLLSNADGYNIVCAVPSVVQHIGVDSSMGHTAGGEPPDVADDFEEVKRESVAYIHKDDNGNIDKMLLLLPDVTLVGVDCVNIERLIKAADLSCRNIKFGEVVLLSSLPSSDKRVRKIKALTSREAYSVFMMKELANYIHTKYLLVIQHDGFVLNAMAWDDDFYNYDYIGAPWEWYTDGKNVGNGGFSFRTKKIMQITANDNDIIPINELGVTKDCEEDHCICRLYRDYLEKEYKMKFAPIEVARKFAIEGWSLTNPVWNGEFGFHGPHLKNISL